MNKKILLHGGLAAFLVLLLVTALVLSIYYTNLPQYLSQHETIILGQSRFTPGSQAALRVLVRDSKDGAPLEDAAIEVEMQAEDGGQPLKLYSGRTGAGGTASVVFQVPQDAARAQKLVVRTQSSLGADQVERPVTIEREYRVLLTTDKPIYQPGQIIHIRALALSTFDRLPAAGQEVIFSIADGKGNRVFRKSVMTNEYGTAATDFQLAGEVNTGDYKISTSLGNTSSEKTVSVEHYVLPKFGIQIQTDRNFYLPGQQVAGSLHAAYFFGKPVADSQVLLEGFTFDVERTQVLSIEGQTSADGSFNFAFTLPDYLAGSDLQSGMARLYLQASITDQAQHTETKNLSLPVSMSTLVIEAVPEGGVLRPGLENILYILTSYPDGTPADTQLTLDLFNGGARIQSATGPYGLAEVRLTPSDRYQQIQIEARDAQGNQAVSAFQFQGNWLEEQVLLRPERPVYTVGESMKLALRTTQAAGTVYLDIVRDGQAISTRSVDISGGQGEVTIDLSPDLAGTLELHAYKILSSGNIVRDTRMVIVSQAEDLSLSIHPHQDTYLPGDTAAIDLQVNGSSGEGVPAAIGLAIVDESVFALAETDPGFAKLYFLLEKEILEPRYDLHGYSITDLVHGLPETDHQLQGAITGAAQASLSEAVKNANEQNREVFSLSANSHYDAVSRAHERKEKAFNWLLLGLYVLFLALPVGMATITVIVLLRAHRLGTSLLAAFILIIGLAAFLFNIPAPDTYPFSENILYRFVSWLYWIEDLVEILLLLMALAFLVGLIASVVIAIRRKDTLLGWTLALIPVFVMVTGLMIYAGQESSTSPEAVFIVVGLGALLFVPLSFLVRFAGELLHGRLGTSLALLPLALFFLFGGALIPVFVYRSTGSMIAPQAANFDGRVIADAPLLAGQAEVKAEEQAAAPGSGEPVQAAGIEAPRLRQYFPETMLWLPDAVTDASGALKLEVPVADSITTWRMTALASSQDGRLGSATAPLRVFQDFFIDLDLPLSLTVGDEVAIPVGVFNYLKEEQTVRLELEQASWFELLGEPTQEMTIAANDIEVVYFRIRATTFGRQPFKVTAWGLQMSDAIQKEVRVFPNGKEILFSFSDRLTPDAPVTQTIEIPPDAIPGTQRLSVKIYPGVLSQVVEGLDSILRMPSGCFEQTSSTTYPNILVLDYLKSTQQVSPEVQMKAEEYINLGYQRLTTFEVDHSGGFSLFGQNPADRMLTAYGLQEFSDMSRVHDVDPAIIERAARWLLSQQASDGSWENDRGLVHEQTWSSLGNDRLPVTAYITWSLLEAGFGGETGTQKGLSYIREFQSQAEDPYTLALVANALVAADLKTGEITPSTSAVLDRLADLAQRDGQSAFWKSGVATFMGSEGQTGSIETTALSALALLRANSHPELANGALVYLVRQKDSFGTWYSTQATVLTLKALIQSVRSGSENSQADLTITLNGGQAKTLQVTSENFDVVQMVSFDDINPGRANTVEIQTAGQGSLMYQVSGSYYLPWDKLALYPETIQGMKQVEIDVTYDRTEMEVNDTVNVHVTMALTEAGAAAESALIDLGIPPGFSVQTEDLQALVARFDDVPSDYAYPTIERYELTGRQILIYVSNLKAGSPLEFSYRLKARFPLHVQSPASGGYDYYNPDIAGEVPPQQLIVNP